MLKGLDDISGNPPWSGRIAIGKGQDFTQTFRLVAGDGRGKPVRVKLTADALASATALVVAPDHPVLASGDKLLFGDDVVVTLSGACAAGETSCPVTAISSLLRQGAVLDKLADLTGWTTVSLEVLSRRGDATPVIAAGSFTMTIETQTVALRGIVKAACLAAVTASLTAGPYYFALWRRDSGQQRVLAEGTLNLVESGFL